MSLIVSVNLNIAKTLIPLRLHRFDHKFLRIQRRSVHRSVAFSITRKNSRVRLSNSTEEPLGTSSEKVLGDKQLPIFEAWNVPWDWKICLFVMMPYLMSIFLTGVVESAGLGASSLPHFENPPSSPLSSDEAAIRLFLDELLKSVVKLSILFVLVSPYRPFPKDIFTYRWNQPFNLQKGWFLWGVGGLAVASSFVLLVKLFLSESSAVIQNEVDPLLRLLPLIGASNASTAALTSLLGIMAPICEETIYRGFLMTSLTKWLPVNASIAISSLVFTLAHHSPGKSLEIFIFGVVLGLVYAQTRNLLAPITMHACWNLGVIFTLMYLQAYCRKNHCNYRLGNEEDVEDSLKDQMRIPRKRVEHCWQNSNPSTTLLTLLETPSRLSLNMKIQDYVWPVQFHTFSMIHSMRMAAC